MYILMYNRPLILVNSGFTKESEKHNFIGHCALLS